MVVKNFIINFELDNHVERDWVNDMNKCTRQEVVLLCAPKKNIISFCVTEKKFFHYVSLLEIFLPLCATPE
jgi:hypothetical protein